MRVPWTARRSNQSILKEINPEYSLEGLMLKLKLRYLGHLMRRANSLDKTLMLGNIEGGKRRGRQRMRWLDGIVDSMDMSEQAPGDSEGQGSLAFCSPCGCKESDTTEQVNNNMALIMSSFSGMTGQGSDTNVFKRALRIRVISKRLGGSHSLGVRLRLTQ